MINISIFNDEVHRDLVTSLDLLQEWGQDTVDLRENIFGGTVIDDISDVQRDHLAKLLSGYSFRIGCLGTRKLVADPLLDQDRLNGTMHSLLRTADAVGCRYIRVCTAAPRPDSERERLALLEQAVPVLRQLADKAGQSGVTLVLENKPTSLTNNGREMADFLHRVNHPAVGVVWDAVNSWIGGKFAVQQDYEDCREYLGLVHLKGAMGRPNDPSAYDRGGLMGRDMFPHSQVVEWLVRDGYSGTITLDLAVSAIDRKEFPLGREQIARESLNYTKNLLRQSLGKESTDQI